MKKAVSIAGIVTFLAMTLSCAIAIADAYAPQMSAHAGWNNDFLRSPGRWMGERAWWFLLSLDRSLPPPTWQLAAGGGLLGSIVSGVAVSMLWYVGGSIWRRERGGDWLGLKRCLSGFTVFVLLSLPLLVLCFLDLAMTGGLARIYSGPDIGVSALTASCLKLAPVGWFHLLPPLLVAIGAAFRTRPSARLGNGFLMAIGAVGGLLLLKDWVRTLAMPYMSMGYAPSPPMTPTVQVTLAVLSGFAAAWMVAGIRGRSAPTRVALPLPEN